MHAEEEVWVATESPRHYRKMVGSKTGIRLCTYCYEEDGKIVYGEYELALKPRGAKVLVCQAHMDRLKAARNVQSQG